MKIEPKAEPVELDEEEEKKVDDDLYGVLPPATATATATIPNKDEPPPPTSKIKIESVAIKRESSPLPPLPLKSALKKPKFTDSQPQVAQRVREGEAQPQSYVKIEPKEEPEEEEKEDDLYCGLPPASASVSTHQKDKHPSSKIMFGNVTVERESSPSSQLSQPPFTAPPALKSALKRSKPSDSQPEVVAPEKRIRFKMTTDASETQVIEAMQKIASHIKSTSKFGKASKLAIQLLQAGSVKPATIDYFFAILDAAMSSTLSCTDASVRADFHALFTASQDILHCLDRKQQNQLITWAIKAVVANDLFTDDSFVFSKATGQIKEAISNLPVVTADEDREEAESLKKAQEIHDTKIANTSSEAKDNEESDPFGLDPLICSDLSGEWRSNVKNVAAAKNNNEEEVETKRFLKSKREALILCLEIAARRYRTPWCQTGIDILVKHAFDNISRFTCQQRKAIEKLWGSIREQQMRRKQGKSVSGKLDMNAFECLQEKYANEKISIRRAVGGGGDRRAQQWLG